MKKLFFTLIALVGISVFSYYYFSTPKILERRLESFLDTLSFGAVSLSSPDEDATDFTSHFAKEVIFSGAGNEIISGTVGHRELREMYLMQFRAASKSAQAKRKDEFHVSLKGADRAEMDATISVDIILRGNSSYTQTLPARLVWVKEEGTWVIQEVKLQLPVDSDLNL